MLTRAANARFFRVLIWSGLVSFSIWKLLSTPALLASLPVDDFVQYWSAGRLQLQGRNPYSPELLFQIQRAAGWTGDRPLMMWNPPWTLFFVMPFAAFSYPVARLLWLLLALFSTVGCSDFLWRYYNGPVPHRWLSWLVGLTFVPNLATLAIGQIGFVLVVGLIGFAYFEKQQRFWLAGVSLLPVLFKPHLVLILMLAILLWGFERRLWGVLAGTGLAVLATLVLAVGANPAAVAQYFDAVANYSILHHLTPTAGGWLRKLLGWQNHWLQFLPTVLGVVWVGFHWMHRRKHWEWRHELPIFLLVSVVATSYGWLFDQIVLLPAVIQASVWTSQKWGHNAAFWTLTAYIGINLSILLLIALRATELHYLWVAPTWLVGYAVYRNLISGEATQAARA